MADIQDLVSLLLAEASWLPTVALLAIKATGLLLVAGVLVELLRPASAALRHLIWTASFGALLALPVLAFTLPSWRVPLAEGLLDGVRAAAEAAVFPETSTGWAPPEAGGAEAAPGLPVLVPAPPVVAWTEQPNLAPEALAALELSAALQEGSVVGPTTGRAAGVASLIERAVLLAMEFAPHVGAALLALWLAGAVLVGAHLLLGRLGIAWLRWHAVPLVDPRWMRVLETLRISLGIRRPVQLLRSRTATMPMTWGVLRPTVLLPASAEGWTPERREVVLLHELVHVQRFDCLTQRLAQLACVVYWPHPLVWWAARRLRTERELACDDQVLHVGTRPSTYAAHLLAVARAFRSPGLAGAAALAMIRSSQLEGRVLAILDQRRNRRSPSPATRLVLGLGAALLILPLAALNPVLDAEADALQFQHDSGELPAPVPWAEDLDAYGIELSSMDDGRVIERQFRVVPGGTLTLDLQTGGEVRILGWDVDEVSVRAERDGPDWAECWLEIDEDDDGVHVVASQDDGTPIAHRFEILVPRHYNVELSSIGGNVEIAGVNGHFSGVSERGELILARLRGVVHLTTLKGSVTVAQSRLDGEVEAHGGTVVLHEVAGSLRGFADGRKVPGQGELTPVLQIAQLAPAGRSKAGTPSPVPPRPAPAAAPTSTRPPPAKRTASAPPAPRAAAKPAAGTAAARQPAPARSVPPRPAPAQPVPPRAPRAQPLPGPRPELEPAPRRAPQPEPAAQPRRSPRSSPAPQPSRPPDERGSLRDDWLDVALEVGFRAAGETLAETGRATAAIEVGIAAAEASLNRSFRHLDDGEVWREATSWLSRTVRGVVRDAQVVVEPRSTRRAGGR